MLEQIRNELDLLEATTHQIDALVEGVGEAKPTPVDVAAMGAFLTSFYGGVERVLLRIAKHLGAPIPSGRTWHKDLLDMFASPGVTCLPRLLDAPLVDDLGPYLAFRHVFVHGYAHLARWDKIRPGALAARGVLERFRQQVEAFVRHHLAARSGP